MQTMLPTDGGPIYAETDLTAFISEPWNAISSLAIVLPAIYWAFKLKWNVKQFPFLYYLMPLLFLGGTGSLLFHEFRSSPFLLWMDVCGITKRGVGAEEGRKGELDLRKGIA